MKINFEIGQKIKHQVEIMFSLFGLEIYKIDGKEVLRKRNFSIRGSRKLTIRDEENTYDLEIKVDTAPKVKSWLFPGDWIAQVYVNGELFISDMTPSLRRKIKIFDRLMMVILISLVFLLATLWLILLIIKMLTK